jgi:hypothetical protein
MLWREWKRDHGCKTSVDQHTTLDASVEMSEGEEAEFAIGFRYQSDDEE